jgi:hypothetical protein
MKKIILLLTVLIQVTVAFSQHFKVGYTGENPNDAMNIYINNADIGGVALVAGDEIAVFDGNLCCGVIVLTAPVSVSVPVEIRPSADDGGNNGFKSGNKIYFRFWDNSEAKEYTNVIPTFSVGGELLSVFQSSASAQVSLSTGSTTKTWTENGTSWNDPDAWDPVGVPEPKDDVILPEGITPPQFITVSDVAYCGSLTFGSGVTMTFPSSASGTASLIVATNITGSPTVTSRRYLVNNGWHMVSSPLSNQPIGAFLGANSAIPTKDVNSRGMMDYNVNADEWSSLYTNETPGLLTPGKGYAVRRNTSSGFISFSGTLSNPNIDVAVTNSGNGWNLLGNPFTSAMYVQQEVFGFLVENAAMLDGSFTGMFLWDPSANGGLGAYTAVGLEEGQPNLASGQGFFIKAASAGNVSFTKQMQVHETAASFKSATISRPSIVLNAKASDISSSTKISFNEEMTLGLDPGYDLGILRNGHGFDIYSKLVNDNGVDFMVQTLPGKSTDSYVIPIGVDATKGGEIIFSANALNLPVGYDVMIEDKLTNSVTDLKNDGLYVAEITANNKGIGRFYLHVGSSVQTAIQEIQKNELMVYNIGQTTYIKGDVSTNAQFLVYSIDGRLVDRFNATSQNLNRINTGSFKPGVYFVNVLDVNKYKPVKFVVGK